MSQGFENVSGPKELKEELQKKKKKVEDMEAQLLLQDKVSE